MRKLTVLLFIFFSCGSAKDWTTSYVGKVVKVEDQKVCVEYETDRGQKAYNCYDHFDGHGYEKGDCYPDFEKHGYR